MPRHQSIFLTGFITLWLVCFEFFNVFALSGHKDSLYQSENAQKIRTIVIDAGHGGRDPGCSSQHGMEKHITLAVALRLGRLINQYFPEIKVIYTRQKDQFIPLHQRARIANENKADLFLSIHCNALVRPDVRGSETYVLGLHRAKDHLDVAKRENAAIYYEEDYELTYGGFDPNSDEGHIFFSMLQSGMLEQSIHLAQLVEEELGKTHGRSRGVRQAGFLVLRETSMPAVLIEAGYLTNAHDGQYLNSTGGQDRIAQAILKALSRYSGSMEMSKPVQHFVRHEQEPRPVVATPKMPAHTASHHHHHKTKPKTSTNPDLQPALEQPLLRVKGPNRRINYKVQIAVGANLIEPGNQYWDNVPFAIEVKKEGNLYRYYAIGFDTATAAQHAAHKLKDKGFPNAFAVAFKEGNRVSLK